MAKTITRTILDKTHKRKVVQLNITCDASYVTGGYALTATECGMAAVDKVEVEVEGVGTHFGVYDYTNSKIVMFVAAGTQVASEADISAIKLRATVIGI